MIEDPVYVDVGDAAGVGAGQLRVPGDAPPPPAPAVVLPLFDAEPHNPRARILPGNIGAAYLAEVRAHQLQFPQKLDAERLAGLAAAKAQKIQAARTHASRSEITAEQAEAVANPGRHIFEYPNPLAKIGTTAGHNEYQQDRAVVANVRVGLLSPEEVLTAMREAVLLAGQYIALQKETITTPDADGGPDQEYEQPKYNTRGSTLAMAVVKGKDVYTASVGDSNVVVVTEDESGNVAGQLLHKVHNPKDPTELARIGKFLTDAPAARAAPAEMVVDVLTRGKVGDVSTSRGLGDVSYAQDGLIYTPEVSHYRLPANYRYGRVAVYSDGISDVLTEADVAKTIFNCTVQPEASVGAILAKTIFNCTVQPEASVGAILCRGALTETSVDNITAVVSNPLMDAPAGLEEEATLLAVLDGHGVNSEELVDWLSAALPSLVQNQVDRLEFLNQKLAEVQAERTRKVDHITLGHRMKTRVQLDQELIALNVLQQALDNFKMTGCYHTFDKQIENVIKKVVETVEATPTCAQGFAKVGRSPRSPRLVRFCQSIQKEARRFADDGFPPEPRNDKGCTIS